MELSVTIRFQVLLVIVFLVGVAAQMPKKNPFLVQQDQRQKHMEEQKRLQQLQQEQLQQQNLERGGQQPPRKQVPAPPPQSRPKPRSWEPTRRQATQSPFVRPQQNQGREQSRRYDGGRKHNRNEMHRNGPGPTPWTRWTEKPRPRQSPWEDKSSKLEMEECDGRPYNARELICCNGSVRRRQGLRPACCGSESFDFVFNLCCDGQVTPRTAGRPFC